MNEIPGPTADEPPDAPPRSDPRLARVPLFFIKFDKLVRGMNLYQGAGAIVDKLAKEVTELAGELTAVDPLTVRLTALGAIWQGHPVTPSDKRTPYLFRLFCDGVRELSFLPGVGAAELRGLAEVLRQDPRGADEDLVTLLWQRGFAHIRYYAVDALALGQAEAALRDSQLYGEGASLLDLGDSGALRLTLSAEDLRVLHADDRFQWVRPASAPPRAPAAATAAVAALSKALTAAPDYARFLRIARLIRGEGDGVSPLILDLFEDRIQRGDARGVRVILSTLAEDPVDRKALLTPARMRALAPLFARHHEALRPALEPLLQDAREGMLAMLTSLPPGAGLIALEGMLSGAGMDLTPFHARRLQSEDEGEVAAAVAALGRIGSPEAMAALATGLSSRLASARRLVLEAMDGRYHPSARLALGRALRDPDPENRILAAEMLGRSEDMAVAQQLLMLIEGSDFSERSAREQQAFYDALANLRDPRSLPHFKKVLNQKRLLQRRTGPDRQQIVVRAMAVMGTDEAREMLEATRKRWGVPQHIKDEIRQVLDFWRSRE